MAFGKIPAHLAMAGGKAPRQRMWEAIRELARQGAELTTYKVSRISAQDDETVRDYLRALAKAGIVRLIKPMDRDGLWELLQDEGAEAPRVNKAGKRLAPDAVECIWRSLRILGDLTAAEAVAQVASAGAKISEEGARVYLQGLSLAGYVHREGGQSGHPARYRLLPGRNTGPLHPIYQRCTFAQVYDPNLDRVVWVKGAKGDVEQLRAMLREWLDVAAEVATVAPGLVDRTLRELAA